MAADTLRSVALLALLLAVLVPAAGAVTWTIEEATVYPQNTTNGSEAVVVAKVVDDDGDPVADDHCDIIDVTYDYTDEQLDVRMVEGKTRGWFYNDTMTVDPDNDTVTVVANGQCDGQQTTGAETQDTTFGPVGNISVSVLTDFDPEGYIAGNNLSVAWNATNHTGDFEPHADLSFALHDIEGNVDVEGSETGGEITQGDANYTTEFTLPPSKGRYVLVANASNTSLSYDRPWGAAARTINVLPRLSGNAHLTPVAGCEGAAPLECEKSGNMTIAFEAVTGSATAVNATFYGESGNITTVPLTEANDTWWNTSYELPIDFNTSAHGWDLNVSLNATDGEVYASDNETLQVQNFTVIDNTQPFVGRGTSIDIQVGPVTPFREFPLPRDNVSEVDLTVRNTSGHIVNETVIEAPFDDEDYDEGTRMFSHRWPVATNVDTGEYSVDARVEDVFGVRKNLSFTFDVLEDGTEGPVVEIAGAGGETGITRFNRTYNTTGNKSITVLLNNTADVPALVTPHFRSDLSGISSLHEDVPVSFSENQLKNVHVNVSLAEKGTYLGDMVFEVHGSFVNDYNLSLPVNLTVNNDCLYLNGSLCLVSTDLDRSVGTVGSFNLTASAVHTGTDASLSITYEGNLSDILAERTISLAADNRTDIALGFTTSAGETGTYTGNVSFTTDNASITLPGSVAVNTSVGDVSVTAPVVELGTFVEGDEVPIDLEITNTGDSRFDSVDIVGGRLDIDESRDVDLDPGNTTTVSVTGTAPAVDGETSVDITVRTPSGAADTASVSLTAYQNYGNRFTLLQNDIGVLRDRLTNVSASAENRSAVQDDLDQAETLIEEGQEAWDNGDYSTAQTRYQEADQLRQSADQLLTDLESSDTDGGDGGGIGLPIIPIVVFIVIVAIIGAILYLSIVPEDEEGESGYGPGPAESPQGF